MTTGYKLYCESCGEDSYVELNKHPKYCPSCGAEIDDTNVAEEELDDIDEEWEKLSEQSLRDLDDEWE